MRLSRIATEQKQIPLILCAAMISMSYGLISDATSQQPQKKFDIARRNLHLIGEKVARAVLDKDIPSLLSYDRADFRSEDEASLKHTKSDLYCFLFDSSCIEGGKWRSVYDKLSHSRQLGIKVTLAKSRYDGHLYGILLFYDRASISDKDLGSPDFLCKESPTRIASWKFKLEDGKWRPVTPMFDNEAEGLCS